jgi:hypothetical protein
MIARRDVVLGGVFATMCSGCCAAASASESIGCVVTGEAADRLFASSLADALNPDYFNRIYMGSGDKLLDFALAQTLSRITEALDVLPGFVSRAPNDAPPGKRIRNGPTVQFTTQGGTRGCLRQAVRAQ